MTGLALEGGGARGAYHIGVVKAYLENGYEFDGFVGTSIGAVNAAMLAQGDFDRAMELWLRVTMDMLFDAEESRLIVIGESKWDMSAVTSLRGGLGKIIESGGVDTSRIRALFAEYIDEDRLRARGRDYGLVTVSIGERKPRELFIEDVPKGELLQYVMASASFPGFKPEIIDGAAHVDGALYNNCPINMLIRKGYDEIIAVRTMAPGVFRRVKTESGVKVRVIKPGDDLGNVMLFSPEKAEKAIRLGYLDGLRSLRGLKGRDYYVEMNDGADILSRLLVIPHSDIMNAGRFLGAPKIPAGRMLFEHIIPKLGAYFKLEKDFDYDDFAVALLEHGAAGQKLERYKVYDYRALAHAVGTAMAGTVEKRVSFRGVISPRKYEAAARLMLRGILERD